MQTCLKALVEGVEVDLSGLQPLATASCGLGLRAAYPCARMRLGVAAYPPHGFSGLKGMPTTL